MEASSKNSVLLEIARREFPTFYAKGSRREQSALDQMVVLTSLIINFHPPSPEKSRDADRTEAAVVAYRLLTEMAEALRRSPTFTLLPLIERMKIESAVIERAGRAWQA